VQHNPINEVSHGTFSWERSVTAGRDLPAGRNHN
jgi:hypothetical protein